MNRLKEFRLQGGTTQHQLAQKVGVSDSFISLIETGKKRPGIETAKKIGEALGCKWYMLFDDEPPNNTG